MGNSGLVQAGRAGVADGRPGVGLGVPAAQGSGRGGRRRRLRKSSKRLCRQRSRNSWISWGRARAQSGHTPARAMRVGVRESRANRRSRSRWVAGGSPAMACSTPARVAWDRLGPGFGPCLAGRRPAAPGSGRPVRPGGLPRESQHSPPSRGAGPPPRPTLRKSRRLVIAATTG